MVESITGVYERPPNALMAEEIKKHPWAFSCPKEGCRFAVCANNEEHARLIEAIHPCPYAGGTTTIGWSITVTLVEQVWKKVDDDMMALMQPEANTDFPALKARLRAFAEVLAIFMKPHFTTADEIAREARRRYDHRNDDEYCTPGLQQRRYEAPPGTPVRSAAPTKTTAAPAKITHNLKPNEVESIKVFAKSGFPKEQLAKTYGVSLRVIEAVLSS